MRAISVDAIVVASLDHAIFDDAFGAAIHIVLGDVSQSTWIDDRLCAATLRVLIACLQTSRIHAGYKLPRLVIEIARGLAQSTGHHRLRQNPASRVIRVRREHIIVRTIHTLFREIDQTPHRIVCVTHRRAIGGNMRFHAAIALRPRCSIFPPIAAIHMKRLGEVIVHRHRPRAAHVTRPGADILLTQTLIASHIKNDPFLSRFERNAVRMVNGHISYGRKEIIPRTRHKNANARMLGIHDKGTQCLFVLFNRPVRLDNAPHQSLGKTKGTIRIECDHRAMIAAVTIRRIRNSAYFLDFNLPSIRFLVVGMIGLRNSHPQNLLGDSPRLARFDSSIIFRINRSSIIICHTAQTGLLTQRRIFERNLRRRPNTVCSVVISRPLAIRKALAPHLSIASRLRRIIIIHIGGCQARTLGVKTTTYQPLAIRKYLVRLGFNRCHPPLIVFDDTLLQIQFVSRNPCLGHHIKSDPASALQSPRLICVFPFKLNALDTVASSKSSHPHPITEAGRNIGIFHQHAPRWNYSWLGGIASGVIGHTSIFWQELCYPIRIVVLFGDGSESTRDIHLAGAGHYRHRLRLSALEASAAIFVKLKRLRIIQARAWGFNAH